MNLRSYRPASPNLSPVALILMLVRRVIGKPSTYYEIIVPFLESELVVNSDKNHWYILRY